MAVHGSGGLGVFLASVVLHSGADVSSVRDPVFNQLEACSPGIEVRMTPKKGSWDVKLGNDHVVMMTHETVALQFTVHTPWGPALDLKLQRGETSCLNLRTIMFGTRHESQISL